jgi:hydroxyethylthiazole kinase
MTAMSSPSLSARVLEDLQAIRAQAPVVHNITNFVVMEPTANALLALGASPVMAHALEEMEEIVSIASALVLNIGTLSEPWLEAMERAGRAARGSGTPVVLDPVGAGASRLRTQAALSLLDAADPAVVRGNGSEILALAGEGPGARGVDSTAGAEEAVAAATFLSRRGSDAPPRTVSVSGAVDRITCGEQALRIHNGSPLMARVTGMGCTASALTGAFLAVNPDPFQAAVHAMAVMGVAGEMAAEEVRGPGSFLPRFHDALYRVGGAELEARLRADEG